MRRIQRLSPFTKYKLPVFVYICIVFALSSIPSDDIPEVKAPFQVDKLVHFCEYGFFSFLIFRAFFLTGKFGILPSAILAVLGAATLGAVDEFYQSFTGRHSDIYDWFADCSGATFAALLSLVFYRRRSGTSTVTRDE